MSDSIPTPTVTLNDGHEIPAIGFGTWPLDDAQVEDAVGTALEVGYRHIDTAVKYGNEVGVGRAIAASGIPRDEIFVTTKLDGVFQGDDRALAGLAGSLERLGLEYVDLLLIHWPIPSRGEFVSTWKTFERLQREGHTHSIGVSNFKPAHLDTLLAETDVVPAVNQIQLSPYITKIAAREYGATHGIVTESWSPLGAGTDLLASPVLAGIAAAHGRTVGQIVLRWHLQLGLVAIPKSATPSRIAENLAVFDFELDAADLAAIATLDQGPEAGVDSDVFGH